MKNLIDELHELDNYEYKVSKDFSKRVMKSIKKEKNKFNYAISMAAVGVVACLAVVLFNNSSFRSSIFDFSKDNIESNNMAGLFTEESNIDLIENIKDESEKVFLDTDNKAGGALVSDSNTNMPVDFDNNFETYQTDKYISENATLRYDINYKEIEKILENAGLTVKVSDEKILVKSTKEKIEDLLKNYGNLIIETDEEYVVIKLK